MNSQHIKKLFFLLIVASLQSSKILTSDYKMLSSSDIQIHNPILQDKTQPNRAMIIFSGATIEPDSYLLLAQKIQRLVPNLYIVSPKCLFNMCFEFLVKMEMKKVLKVIKKISPGIDQIFLSGHSLGGSQLGSYYFGSKEAQEKINGLILMGAYITRSYYQTRLKSQLPILTIAGDLDIGAAKSVKLAEDLMWIMKRPKAELLKINPVIVLKGVNHLQFTDGNVQEKIRKMDIKPEVSRDEAQEMMSKFISHFILAQTPGTEFEKIRNENQNKISDEMLNNSLQYLHPIFKIFEEEGNSMVGYSTSPLTKKIQQKVSAIPEEEFEANFEVENSSMSVWTMIKEFVKPKFEKETDNQKVKISTFVAHRMSLQDLAIDYSSYKAPYEMLIKIKSTNSFEQFGYSNTSDAQKLCKEIQEDLVSMVVKELPKRVLDRLEKYQQKLVVNEPVIHNIGIQWLLQPMKTEDKEEEGLFITPSYLFTENSQKPQSIAGMFYCKVWGPSKLMEWFYSDALRFALKN